MKTFSEKLIHLQIAVPVFLGLLFAVAPLIAAGVEFQERYLITRFERILMYLCAASGAGLIWISLSQTSQRAPNSSSFTLFSITYGRNVWLSLGLIPAFAFCLHNVLFTLGAYEALFFADEDITNISAAIANTATGHGILQTPYLHVGEHGSYLGHHFAPALLLFVPIYWIAMQLPIYTNHLMHPISLSLALIAGVISWIYFVSARFKNSDRPFLIPIALSVLFCAFPLFRLSQAFHNEILVLVFSGVLFASVYSGNRAGLFLGLLGWLCVKEDMALYLGLFGIFLLSHKRKSGLKDILMSDGMTILCVSALYLLFSRLMQGWFGGSIQDWNFFFQSGWPKDVTWIDTLKAFGYLLLAFGLLPLLSPRMLLICIVPILIVHLFSKHPWHATFYGHYSYDLLPFLMLGTVQGLERIFHKNGQTGPQIPFLKKFSTPILCLSLGLACYAAAADQETPSPIFAKSPDFENILATAMQIKRNSCIQAESDRSAFVPLHSRVFPQKRPEGNPHGISVKTILTEHCACNGIFNADAFECVAKR